MTAGSWSGEGGYSKVYLVPIFPPVAIHGERVHNVVIKAAKMAGIGDLNVEIEELALLEHPNIVRILGYSYCHIGPKSTQKSFVLALDYCCTDLQKLSRNR